jgi:hypothetical protein
LTAAWCALAGTSLLYLFRDPKKRRAAWTGVAAFAVGLCLHPLQSQWETKLELLPKNLRSRRVTLYGRVDSPIERGGRSERILLRMEKIETPGGAIPIRSRARPPSTAGDSKPDTATACAWIVCACTTPRDSGIRGRSITRRTWPCGESPPSAA